MGYNKSERVPCANGCGTQVRRDGLANHMKRCKKRKTQAPITTHFTSAFDSGAEATQTATASHAADASNQNTSNSRRRVNDDPPMAADSADAQQVSILSQNFMYRTSVVTYCVYRS